MRLIHAKWWLVVPVESEALCNLHSISVASAGHQTGLRRSRPDFGHRYRAQATVPDTMTNLSGRERVSAPLARHNTAEHLQGKGTFKRSDEHPLKNRSSHLPKPTIYRFPGAGCFNLRNQCPRSPCGIYSASAGIAGRR